MRPLYVAIAALALGCTPASRDDGAIESMLSEIANQQRIMADQTHDPRDYAAAADAYEAMLTQAPHSSPEHRWELADTQHRAGRYEQAAASFETLIGTQYDDVAVYMSYRCWHRVAFSDSGMGDQGEFSPHPMSHAEEKFTSAVARVLQHDFKHTPTGVPSLKVAASRHRPAMLLESAEVFARHRRAEKARPLLRTLMTDHRDSPHATSGAELLERLELGS